VSDNPSREAFIDLLSYLERLETQTGAMLQVLKDKGIVTDEQLAPYLEQSGKASDVRMRGARARMEHLFTADETAKPAAEATTRQQEGKRQEQPEGTRAEQPKGKREEQPEAAEGKPKPSPEPKNEPSQIISATADNSKSKDPQEKDQRKKDAA
jgi:hypothetical protein